MTRLVSTIGVNARYSELLGTNYYAVVETFYKSEEPVREVEYFCSRAYEDAFRFFKAHF
jgi:hypothetical protein